MAITTRIWFEEPVEGNDFAPEKSFLFGRDFFSGLAEKHSFIALVYLHITGRIPSPEQEKLLGFLLNLSANPGIRDESTLVAMNTAIGSAPLVNSVLAGLMARSGLNRGSLWVERVMENLHLAKRGEISLKDCSQFSGLGKHYDHIDKRAVAARCFLKANGCWGETCCFLESHESEDNWLLLEGVIAAGFLDLGISPAAGSILFLMSVCPALAAFSLEQQEQGYKMFPHYFEPGHYSFPSIPIEKNEMEQ
ncbi:MAG: hypothetical protein AB1403_18540 [Candidatus Riflebacteria bacterium]